jgi:hypothetical protein
MIDENIDEYWRAGVQFRFKNNSFYEIHLFKNSKSSELKMRLHMNSLDKNFELGDSMPDIHFDSSIKFEIQLVGENIEIKLNNEILNRERIGQEFEFSEVSFNAWADGKKYKIKFNDIVVKA